MKTTVKLSGDFVKNLKERKRLALERTKARRRTQQREAAVDQVTKKKPKAK